MAWVAAIGPPCSSRQLCWSAIPWPFDPLCSYRRRHWWLCFSSRSRLRQSSLLSIVGLTNHPSGWLRRRSIPASGIAKVECTLLPATVKCRSAASAALREAPRLFCLGLSVRWRPAHCSWFAKHWSALRAHTPWLRSASRAFARLPRRPSWGWFSLQLLACEKPGVQTVFFGASELFVGLALERQAGPLRPCSHQLRSWRWLRFACRRHHPTHNACRLVH